MPDVVVVGAGPVGLLLAGELTRRGVDVTILERREAAGAGSRAIGVHAPVLAALEASGLTAALLAEAVRVGRGEARSRGRTIGEVRFERLSTRFPFVATLPQAATERLLSDRAPAPQRGARVAAVIPGKDSVRLRVALAGAQQELTAPLVVVAAGAGGRDIVYRRGAVAVREYRDRYLMTDAAVDDGAEAATAVVNLDPEGVLESFPLPGGIRRFVAWDRPGSDPDPAARSARLRAAVAMRDERAAEGIVEATEFGVRRVVAPRLRNGRVLVIGDAAHEVSPIGGQGMNLGLLDAATLAPLLTEWVRGGEAPEGALRRWERDRLASARSAARLAAVNTALGRPLPSALHAARSGMLRTVLTPPADRLFAHAYSMGLDRAAG